MSAQRFFRGSAGICFWCFSILAAWAGEAESPEASLSITSKTMIAKNMDRMIIFEGDVVLSKGEFELTAERLEVTLSLSEAGSGPSGGGEDFIAQMSTRKDAVERIEAIGRVQVTHGDRHGKADRAVYDHRDEKVILTGNPEVWERDYRVSGRKMIFYLRENKNVVEDSKAVVFPK